MSPDGAPSLIAGRPNFSIFVALNFVQNNMRRDFVIPDHVRDDPIRKRPAKAGRRIRLLTKTKLRDEGGITLAVDFLQIIEKRTTLIDHLEKTTTRMIILVVVFKMRR